MSARRRWLGPVWILSVVVAAWIGSRRGDASRPPTDHAPPTAALAAAPPLRSVAIAGVRHGVDADLLRQIVRDELALHDAARAAAAPMTGATAPSATAAPTTPPPLDPAQQAQGDDAAAIVARAIDAGRWTVDDRRRFAGATQALPLPARFELQRALHVSINRGQVTPADGLPPFGPLLGEP